jgi:transcriptional regulator with XRE-family HTH domain
VPPAKRKSKAPSLAELVQARVRILRTARGLTQEELCERAGVSVDAVTRIESGRRTPNLATVERLAAGLGVPPSELLVPHAEPLRRRPATAERIAVLVEAEPATVQRAIEKIVRTVIGVSRSR